MNKCVLIGRLTRNPEIRFSENSQMLVARFTLAVDRIGKRKEGDVTADFINCVAFDKNADFAEQYTSKGIRVAVCGRIENDNYTNQQGEKVYSVALKVQEIEFADGKRDQKERPQEQTMAAAGSPAAGKTTAPASKAASTTSRTTAPASNASASSRTAAPAAGQGTSRPAANRNSSQRPAPSRSATGRAASQRAPRAAAGDGFMNVASGMEEGLPFN